MPECPGCLGEGEHDFTDVDVPLARMARLFGVAYVPGGVVVCTVCAGSGEITDAEGREWEAWAVARVDQFLAAVDSGEIKV